MQIIIKNTNNLTEKLASRIFFSNAKIVIYINDTLYKYNELHL